MGRPGTINTQERTVVYSQQSAEQGWKACEAANRGKSQGARMEPEQVPSGEAGAGLALGEPGAGVLVHAVVPFCHCN